MPPSSAWTLSAPISSARAESCSARSAGPLVPAVLPSGLPELLPAEAGKETLCCFKDHSEAPSVGEGCHSVRIRRQGDPASQTPTVASPGIDVRSTSRLKSSLRCLTS